jgi:hypothetical protein
MTLVAVTNLGGGKVIPAGEKVTKKDFDGDEEVIEHLKSLGSLAEPDTAEALEPDERDARIQELEAELARLSATSAPGPEGPETPLSNAAGTKKPTAAEAAKATGQASGK